MKIVLNRAYGGYHLPREYAEATDTNFYDDSFEVRTDPDLIEYVTAHSHETDLEVIEFPDEATDYDVLEYDGLETLIYVLDGHLYYV